MNSRRLWLPLGLLVCVASSVAAGCKGREKAAPPETPTATGVGAAFCSEHGVPEAACTKCNPGLIAGFKAKGDWCNEHGFPESVCPVCHPPGQPPAAEVAEDGAPVDGTRVCLKSPEAAAMAGLTTVKASERPEGSGLTAPATITFNATRRAIVNARSAGVVRALMVDVGARVAKGTPLAVIDSGEVGAERSRLQGARSRMQIAEQNYRREKELRDKGITSARELLDAQQELEAARAENAALSASLGVVGRSAGGTGGYTLTAPLAGSVVRRNATVGELVGVDEMLLEIVDTSTMWADLAVAEDELTSVAVGQTVVVTAQALPRRFFNGQIDYISPEVDPHTRTTLVRASLANPDGVLRANMFADARIVLGQAKSAVVVPSGAVQRVKDVAFAFVRIGPDKFEVRRLELGNDSGGMVEVTRGLRPTEDVVADGSFVLKAEALKESMGDGCVDD